MGLKVSAGLFKNAFFRGAVTIAGILAFGTVGYTLIEGWPPFDALYMTLITVTTIGYGEIRPLGMAGRAFTSVLIVFGIGTAASAVTGIGSAMLENRLGRLLGKKKMDDRIKTISGHFIVCAYNDIGASMATELGRGDVPFVVIAQEGEEADRAQALGYPVLRGDFSLDSTLIAAGIRRARGLAICSGDLTSSLVASMAARELNPSAYLIVHGTDPGMEERLLRAGADTVSYPLRLGGREMARLVMQREGATKEIGSDSAGFSVESYRVFDDAKAGVTVGEVIGRAGAKSALCLLKADGSELESPGSGVKVASGDVVVLLARSYAVSGDLAVPEWSESMSVGIGEIDEEHRGLLVLIGRVGDAAERKAPGDEIASILDKLVQYTERHFVHEERLLADSGYPEFAEHREEHRKLRARVIALSREGRTALPADLRGFLLDWLKNHILGTDMRYAEFLGKRGNRDSPA